jgi:hypothetical protein
VAGNSQAVEDVFGEAEIFTGTEFGDVSRDDDEAEIGECVDVVDGGAEIGFAGGGTYVGVGEPGKTEGGGVEGGGEEEAEGYKCRVQNADCGMGRDGMTALTIDPSPTGEGPECRFQIAECGIKRTASSPPPSPKALRRAGWPSRPGEERV